MAHLDGGLLSLVLGWKQMGSRSLALLLVVTTVWLAIFETIVLTVPTPEQAVAPGFFYTVGQQAHLHGFQGKPLKVPQELTTFKDLYQALWDDNSLAINEVLARPGWILADDGQAVRIIGVYQDGFQVELLDGSSAGRQAWVMRHQLGP